MPSARTTAVETRFGTSPVTCTAGWVPVETPRVTPCSSWELAHTSDSVSIGSLVVLLPRRSSGMSSLSISVISRSALDVLPE